MTDLSQSYEPRANRSDSISAIDPLLLELGLAEVQQDNARLRQIIAELLLKNQLLRWALQGKTMTPMANVRLVQSEEVA